MDKDKLDDRIASLNVELLEIDERIFELVKQKKSPAEQTEYMRLRKVGKKIKTELEELIFLRRNMYGE